MNIQKIRACALVLLAGSFFVLDRIFKYQILLSKGSPFYLYKPWIGFEYFENRGVAFGIPIPWYVSFIITPVIFILVFRYFQKKHHSSRATSFSLGLIFFGALSNFLDRIIYHFTIDYIRIFTSLINIADIMIVWGTLLFFFQEVKNKPVDNLQKTLEKF